MKLSQEERLRAMDENSLESFNTLDRQAKYPEILNAYEVKGPMTDREVAHFLGYSEDLNKVRPRISELIDKGMLMVSGRVRDDKTGKTVRLVRRAWNTEVQLRLFA